MSDQPEIKPSDHVTVLNIDKADELAGIVVGGTYEVYDVGFFVRVKVPSNSAYPHPMRKHQVTLTYRPKEAVSPAARALPGDLTLRDYFAAHALSGLGHWRCVEELAALAYTTADAMLKERSK